jgi:hypothetical protein
MTDTVVDIALLPPSGATITLFKMIYGGFT